MEEREFVTIIFVHWSQNEERSQLARASLKSLQATIHIPAEIIVVDNGDNEEDSKFFLKECQEKRIALYIRNADNVNFPTARNQGLMNATGNWIVITDNDIIYKDHWLNLCMAAISNCPNDKRLASPINYPYVHGRDPRWRHGQLRIKGRMFNLTERAGSNCLVMNRKAFDEIGFFNLDKASKSGSDYTDKWVNAGYLVITPTLNWAYDCGLRKGHNFNIRLEATRTLLDGSKTQLTNQDLWKK